MKILDIGCGCNSQGTVNTDLFINDVGHRLYTHKTINTKKTANFVLSKAPDYLPFQSGSFEIVVSRQLIEHLEDPQKLLDEMLRISNNKFIIETAFGLGDKLAGANPTHKQFFSTRYFKKYAKLRNLTLIVKITKFMQNRIGLFFNIPLEIRYTFQK